MNQQKSPKPLKVPKTKHNPVPVSVPTPPPESSPLDKFLEEIEKVENLETKITGYTIKAQTQPKTWSELQEVIELAGGNAFLDIKGKIKSFSLDLLKSSMEASKNYIPESDDFFI